MHNIEDKAISKTEINVYICLLTTYSADRSTKSSKIWNRYVLNTEDVHLRANFNNLIVKRNYSFFTIFSTVTSKSFIAQTERFLPF